MKFFTSLNRKQKLEFILFSACCVIFFTFLYLISPPIPTPNNIPTPTSTPKIISMFPPNLGEQDMLFPDLAVIFYFNTSLDVNKLKIEINPNLNYSIEFNSTNNSLIIRPSEKWEYNIEYTISISEPTLEKNTFRFLPRKPDLTKPQGVPAEIYYKE